MHTAGVRNFRPRRKRQPITAQAVKRSRQHNAPTYCYRCRYPYREVINQQRRTNPRRAFIRRFPLFSSTQTKTKPPTHGCLSSDSVVKQNSPAAHQVSRLISNTSKHPHEASIHCIPARLVARQTQQYPLRAETLAHPPALSCPYAGRNQV